MTTQRALAALILSGALLSPMAAHAQSAEDVASARAVATEGAKAFVEGRWADTVDLMSRAEKIVHSPTHLLYIARAYDKLGKLVLAQESYIKIVRSEVPAGSPEAFRVAQADAQKELAALKTRIPYISVVVQGAGPLPVVVMMDGVKVPEVLVGVPRPVDPGTHKFEAFAEGTKSNVNTVTIEEGARETVLLTLKEGAEGAPAGGPAAGGTAGSGTAGAATPGSPPPGGGAPADTGTEKSGPNGMKIAGFAAIGAGAVVGGVLGGVFLAGAAKKTSEADDLYGACGGSSCPPAEQEEVVALDDDAASKRTIGVVGLVVGGVAIAGGVTLVILSGGKEKRAATELVVGPGSFALRGRF